MKVSTLAPQLRKLNRLPSSDFKEWWFFDTNCLSYLVKQHLAGKSDQIKRFLENAAVLVTSSNIHELSRSNKKLVDNLFETLKSTLTCFIPDITNYWKYESESFLNLCKPGENILQLSHLSEELINRICNNAELEKAISVSDEFLNEEYFNVISSDIGAPLDERDIRVHIFSIIQKFIKESYNEDLQPKFCTYSNFPSYYSHLYTYYCHYVKQPNIKAEVNDFIDIGNAIVAPYCKYFFTESKLASTLKNRVQKLTPPNYYSVVKKTNKKIPLKGSVIKEAKKIRDSSPAERPLLEKTIVYEYSNLVNKIEG